MLFSLRISRLNKQFHHSPPSTDCILRIIAASQCLGSETSKVLVGFIVPNSTGHARQQLLTWDLERGKEKFELDEGDSSTTTV